jgi:S1/P1 Nuclease
MIRRSLGTAEAPLSFTMPQLKQSRPIAMKSSWLARSVLRAPLRATSLPVLLMFFAAAGLAPSAWGWGCKGHQVVALIAEAHLNAHARAMAAEILDAGPISPDVRRFCGVSGLDAFADSSTWADDVRGARPETYDWHFLDIPRGAPKGDIAQYCPQPASCVTSAIADQLAVLRKPGASAQERADALRYVIHFVGDLHQPLHATTNDDRGGNCVPVAYFGNVPVRPNPATEDYRPNLHGIWDTDIIEHFANGQTAQQVADELGVKFQKQLAGWQSKPVDVTAWAWESHQLAEDATYGDLPVKIAIEKPVAITACSDDDHISTRMFNLHEELGDDYQHASETVIEEQLTKAGIRLAAVLNNLWP